MLKKVLYHSFEVNEFKTWINKNKPKAFSLDYLSWIYKRDWYVKDKWEPGQMLFMVQYYDDWRVNVGYILNNSLQYYRTDSFDNAENFMLTFKIN